MNKAQAWTAGATKQQAEIDALRADRDRLAASEANLAQVLREALSDFLFVERVGPAGTNMQSSILRIRAALAGLEEK